MAWILGTCALFRCKISVLKALFLLNNVRVPTAVPLTSVWTGSFAGWCVSDTCYDRRGIHSTLRLKRFFKVLNLKSSEFHCYMCNVINFTLKTMGLMIGVVARLFSSQFHFFGEGYRAFLR